MNPAEMTIEQLRFALRKEAASLAAKLSRLISDVEGLKFADEVKERIRLESLLSHVQMIGSSLRHYHVSQSNSNR